MFDKIESVKRTKRRKSIKTNKEIKRNKMKKIHKEQHTEKYWSYVSDVYSLLLAKPYLIENDYRSTLMNKVIDKYKITSRMAQHYISDAFKLYASRNINKSDNPKKVELFSERFDRLAYKSEQDKKYKEAIEATKQQAIIEGVYNVKVEMSGKIIVKLPEEFDVE